MSRSRLGVALALVLGSAANPAFAVCTQVGLTATCTGTDLDGFDSNGDSLTVNIEPGAIVNGSDGIKVEGNDNTVNNDGTIDTTDEGIVGGVGLSVVNTGSINAADKGIDADDLGNVSVNNFGDVTAGDKVIRIGGGANAVLTNSGNITALGDEGFEAGDNATVTNTTTGVIKAADDAVQVGENAIIQNSGLIENNGTNTANKQDAIDIESGTITNSASGTIKSTLDAAIDYDGSTTASVINNFGLITGTTGVLVEKGLGGETPNTANQTINNHGSIIGTAGLALDLGAGNDVLNLYDSGSLTGGADFGTGDDALNFFGTFTGAIAGGSILNGGVGTDTVTFDVSLTLMDLSTATLVGDVLDLAFLAAGSDFSVRLQSWESFTLGTQTYSAAELVAAANPTTVPVPALLALLAGGLIGVGLTRRKKTA